MKRIIRQTNLLRRKGISTNEREYWSRACCERLVDTAKALPSGAIAGYVAIQNELDVAFALVAFERDGRTVVLPIIVPEAKPLRFHRWRPGDPLVKGAYGELSPLPSAEIVTPDWLLVPMLAFDRQGHRLGYGGGHYDATLRELRRADPEFLAIGVAFACQEIPEIPVESHDERLDLIITEREVIRIA